MKLSEIHFKVIPSTSRYGKENISLFDKEGWTWITADFQTEGRGRWGRVWVSPPDVNIYASLCFSLKETSPLLYLLPLFVAERTQELLQEEGVATELKPPNDLLIKGKKVAGILAESVPLMQGNRWVVVGVGLNVNMEASDLSPIGQPATSLKAATGRPWEIPPLRERLKERLIARLEPVLGEKEAAKLIRRSK